MVSFRIQNTQNLLIQIQFSMLLIVLCCCQQNTYIISPALNTQRDSYISINVEIADSLAYRPGHFTFELSIRNQYDYLVSLSDLRCFLWRWNTTDFSLDSTKVYRNFRVPIIENGSFTIEAEDKVQTSIKVDLSDTFFEPGDNYFRVSCTCEVDGSAKKEEFLLESEMLHIILNPKEK